MNDRLLLGMKGTFSELELSILRQRSLEALRLKASRGDLHTSVALGYVRSASDRLEMARDKLKHHADGDQQFVKVLGAVLDHGLAAVETACAEAMEAGLASGDVILTVLARRRQPEMPASITTPLRCA